MPKLMYFDKNVILLSSHAGGKYVEPEEPSRRWDWPQGTWLQRRRAQLLEGADGTKTLVEKIELEFPDLLVRIHSATNRGVRRS